VYSVVTVSTELFHMPGFERKAKQKDHWVARTLVQGDCEVRDVLSLACYGVCPLKQGFSKYPVSFEE
jgi:hypothetical protein